MKKLLRTFILRCSHKWEPDVIVEGCQHYTSPNNIAYKIDLTTGQWFCLLQHPVTNSYFSGKGIMTMFYDDIANHRSAFNHAS